jgi:HEAT repeat protein
MGPAAAPAVAGLAGLLRDPSPDLRRVAAAALGQVGLAARKAVAELRAAREDQDNAVREQVAATLKKLELPAGGGE